MVAICVNALSGIAFEPTDAVAVFGVVPFEIPPVGDEPLVDVAPDSTFAGLLSTFDDGVYLTAVVSAFDPAEAEAEEEKEVTAPAPVAPADAFD